MCEGASMKFSSIEVGGEITLCGLEQSTNEWYCWEKTILDNWDWVM